MAESTIGHRSTLLTLKVFGGGVAIGVAILALILLLRGWTADVAWWRDNGADISSQAVTFIGIVVGALLVTHQLQQQHKSSLEVQRWRKGGGGN